LLRRIFLLCRFGQMALCQQYVNNQLGQAFD
jgi:hypothetical protein